MKSKTRRILLALAAAIFVALALLHLRGEMILGKFADLQRTFDGNSLDPQFSPPRWVPRVMVNQLDSYVDKHHGNDPRAFALKQRLYIILGARIPPIRLTNVKSIRPEFCDALRKLSDARSVEVWFSSQSTELTEVEATQVCEALRDMPRLAYIDLIGVQFTDASVARLAGHPKIDSLRLPASRITRASIPTFASMPSLDTLLLMTGVGNTAPSEETLAITKALSGKVTVQQR